PEIPAALAGWAPRFLGGYFPDPPSGLHDWLCPELDALRQTRGTLLNVVAPRGGGKSVWASFAHPLRAACAGQEPYILLLADTATKACKNLKSIRLERESNAELARAYPGATGRGPVWRQSELELRNGVTVEALGTGAQGLRGRRNRLRLGEAVGPDRPRRL